MYIVTGYKGFVGKRLIQELNSNTDTKGFDRDDEYLDYLVSECDGVFHIGACSDLREPDVNYMFNYNVERSLKLFKLAKTHNKKVVYASSSAIYGNGKGPTNIYSWSKYVAEVIGQEILGGSFVALRFYNIYGVGEEHKGLMSSIPYHIYHSDTFGIFPIDGSTNKSPKRDFVFIDDVIDGLLIAMNSDVSGVFDLGTGYPTQYDDICNIMEKEFYYLDISKKPRGYQDYTCAKIKEFLPEWKPRMPIEGLEIYKKQLNGYK